MKFLDKSIVMLGNAICLIHFTIHVDIQTIYSYVVIVMVNYRVQGRHNTNISRIAIAIVRVDSTV